MRNVLEADIVLDLVVEHCIVLEGHPDTVLGQVDFGIDLQEVVFDMVELVDLSHL